MSTRKSPKLGDVHALLRSAPSSVSSSTSSSSDSTPTATNDASSASSATDPLMVKRQVLAEFCRLADSRLSHSRQPHPLEAGLPPRVKETLQCLLAGDSEKQIARKLGVSRHTIHVYVKTLHKRFEVSSRGELLAKWVRKTG